MSIYVEEMLGVLKSLDDFCDRLLRKMEIDPPPGDLLIEIEALKVRIREVEPALPINITFGEWSRKLHWMDYWVSRGKPSACVGDLEEFRDHNIAITKKQIQEWGSTLGAYDEELRAAVKRLISLREFSSAIRQAFVILTERLRKKFNMPLGCDGVALVNEIYGKNSALTTSMGAGDRQAMRDYLSGAYGLLRNKYAHGDPPLDLVELEATLASVNLALKLI